MKAVTDSKQQIKVYDISTMRVFDNAAQFNPENPTNQVPEFSGLSWIA